VLLKLVQENSEFMDNIKGGEHYVINDVLQAINALHQAIQVNHAATNQSLTAVQGAIGNLHEEMKTFFSNANYNMNQRLFNRNNNTDLLRWVFNEDGFLPDQEPMTFLEIIAATATELNPIMIFYKFSDNPANPLELKKNKLLIFFLVSSRAIHVLFAI
jgi:hypothetical protein